MGIFFIILSFPDLDQFLFNLSLLYCSQQVRKLNERKNYYD